MRDVQTFGRAKARMLIVAVLFCTAALFLFPYAVAALYKESSYECVEASVGQACEDNTFGFQSIGTCIAPGTCLALSTVAITGGAILVGKGIVDSIFKGNPQSPNIGTPLTGALRCPSYYQTSTITSDPCAIYVPQTTSSQLPRGISDLLNSSLGAGVQSVSQTLLNPTVARAAAPAVSPSPTIMPLTISGAKGDLYANATGATIQAGVRDAERNAEYAAFFGASVPKNAPPQNFVERMCTGRPWQNPLVANVIPLPIFDDLCVSHGYRAGFPLPPQPPAPVRKQAAVATPIATSTEQMAPPKVDIWTVPPAVPSGARTAIFWNATGVSKCEEKSSDGSWSGDTVSGNSASAPITKETVFAITCLAPDNTKVSNFVRVNVTP